MARLRNEFWRGNHGIDANRNLRWVARREGKERKRQKANPQDQRDEK